MPRDWRRLAQYAVARVVGLTVLSGLTALGPGSFGAASAAPSTTKPRAKATTKAPTVTTSVAFTVDLQVRLPQSYAFALRGAGQADFAHRDVSLSFNLPTAGLHSSAIGKGVPRATGSLLLQGEWVDGTAYVKVPASLTALAGGAQNLSYAVPAATARQVDTAIDQSAVALTYTHLLIDTLAGHQSRHNMGSRSIGGVPATGTQIDLTLSQLLKVIPGLIPAMTKDIGKMADTKIPATIWVDAGGRLVEASMGSSAKTALGTITGSVQFSNYNAPVSIAAPPAGEVRPVSKSELALLEAANPFGAKR